MISLEDAEEAVKPIIEALQKALLVLETIEEDGNINCPELGIVNVLKELIKKAA